MSVNRFSVITESSFPFHRGASDSRTCERQCAGVSGGRQRHTASGLRVGDIIIISSTQNTHLQCVALFHFSSPHPSVTFSSMMSTPSVGIWPELPRLLVSMEPTQWSRLRFVRFIVCDILEISWCVSEMLIVLYLQVDYWLEFSARRLCGQPDLTEALADLDKALSLRTFLVGHALTLADLSVWAALKGVFSLF